MIKNVSGSICHRKLLMISDFKMDPGLIKCSDKAECLIISVRYSTLMSHTDTATFKELIFWKFRGQEMLWQSVELCLILCCFI